MGFVSSLFGANNDYNATGAQGLANTDYSGALARALAATGPVNNSQGDATRAYQNQLAQMLFSQASGNGPSVAENQLRQTTDSNNRAAAGMIGAQHGINPALAARMILQNNAANNQNAAAAGATLRAQEQLGAMGQLGQALGTQRSQDISQAQGNATTNAGLVQALGGLQNTQNANQITNALGAQQINAGVSGQNANTNGSIAGGLLSGLSSAMAGSAVSGKWRGGPVGYADGGEVANLPNFMGAADYLAKEYPATGLKQGFSDFGKAAIAGSAPSTTSVGDPSSFSSIGSPMAGDQGEAAGGGGGGGIMSMAPMLAMMAAQGGKIPGKAPVKGDSPTNDTVPTMLSPDEVVLPRSVVNAKNSPEKAKEFMAAIKRQQDGDSDEGYGKVLKAQRLLHERLAAVEKYCMGGKVR